MAVRDVCFLCLTKGLTASTPVSDRNRLSLWIIRNDKDGKCSFQSVRLSLREASVRESLIEDFIQRMEALKDSGIDYLLDIIDSAEELLSGSNDDEFQPITVVNKSSPIGLLIRQAALNVKKLSLHGLTELHTEVVRYVSGVDKSETERPSQDEVSPDEPTDFGQLLVDSMNSENYPAALNSLQRYFDYSMKPADKKVPSSSLAVHHAALGLALLHHHFDHIDQALMSLYECIRLSQATSDAECLEHALSWLHVLTASDAPSSEALIETLEQRTLQSKHGIGLLARLRHLSQIVRLSTSLPARVFVEFEASGGAVDVGTTPSGHLLQSTLWKRAGQRILSSVHDQQLLRSFDPDRPVLLTNTAPINTVHTAAKMAWQETFFYAIVNHAAFLADEGRYDKALEQLTLAERQCMPGSRHFKIWMVCREQVHLDCAVYSEDWLAAERSVQDIKALQSTEGLLQEAVVCLFKEDFAAAFKHTSACLSAVSDVAENREIRLRLLLLMAEIHLGTGQPHVALDYASRCLEMSRLPCHFGSLEAQATLLLARIWVQLGDLDKSLGLIRDVIIDILSQGSQFLRGLAHFTLAQTSMLLLTREQDKENPSRTAAYEAVVAVLEAALLAFSRIKAVRYMRQVLHYQVRVFHLMGYKKERNESADKLRQQIIQLGNVQ